MDYKITQIEMVKDSSALYVEAEFLENDEVVHRNDFVMQVKPTRRVYSGPPLAEGEEPDPENYTVEQVDVAGVITANIESYIDRFEARPQAARKADNRSRKIQRDKVDRLAVLNRAELRALLGQVRQKGPGRAR